jgi:hypothetical protein
MSGKDCFLHITWIPWLRIQSILLNFLLCRISSAQLRDSQRLRFNEIKNWLILVAQSQSQIHGKMCIPCSKILPIYTAYFIDVSDSWFTEFRNSSPYILWCVTFWIFKFFETCCVIRLIVLEDAFKGCMNETSKTRLRICTDNKSDAHGWWMTGDSTCPQKSLHLI